MRRKKTREGIEIGRTLGMREKKGGPLWLVVGQRAHVQVFRAGDEENGMLLVHDFVFPEGRQKGRELVSDHPGRTFDSWSGTHGGHQTAAPRHSFSSESDPKEHLAETLSATVANWLKERHREGRFSKLVLVAEPHFLGHLRRALDRATSHCVIAEHEKNLAWLSEAALAKRLGELVPELEQKAKRVTPPPFGDFRLKGNATKRGKGLISR